MTKKTSTTSTLDDLVLLMQALGDANRLRILALLIGRDELCVCDIQRVLDMPQPRVSRHLNMLRHAGCVRARRSGRWMYYALRRDNVALLELLDALNRGFSMLPEFIHDRNSLDHTPDLVCCSIPLTD